MDLDLMLPAIDFEIVGIEKGLFAFGTNTHYIGVSYDCSKFFACPIREALVENRQVIALQEDLIIFPEGTAEYLIFRRLLCIKYQWPLSAGDIYVGSERNRVFIGSELGLSVYTFDGDQCDKEFIQGYFHSMLFRRLG